MLQKIENSTFVPEKQKDSPIERGVSVEPVSQGRECHDCPQQHTHRRHNPSSRLHRSFGVSLASHSFNISQKMTDVLVEEPPDNEVQTNTFVARVSS